MADGSKIEWTEATWNPITGCSLASPGCTNCYAMLLAGTRLAGHPSRSGLTRESGGRPKWTGEVRFNEQWLDQPLRWKRPRTIFVCAHGDLFHENVPDAWIDRVFAVMALSPRHAFQVLTKRSARMREYVSSLPNRDDLVADQSLLVSAFPSDADKVKRAVRLPLPNVWLGVSVEDQQRADERRDNLANTPAAVKFVSYEPALGPVDWTGWAFINQIISGGESGPKARASHPNWHRATRDFCAGNGIAFFFKQWGNWAPATIDLPSYWLEPDGKLTNAWEALPSPGAASMMKVGKKLAGRRLDGQLHDAMPTGPEDADDPNVNDRVLEEVT